MPSVPRPGAAPCFPGSGKISATGCRRPPSTSAPSRLSAAVCGGLLDRRNIAGLVRRASEPIAVAGRLSYFDFETIHMGVKVEMLQRWHPDALTEALLARLPAGSDCSISEKALLVALKSIVAREARSAPPRSLATLVRCATSFWLQRASRIDVEVARGSRLTQSLKQPVWLRLHQAKPFPKVDSKAPRPAAARTRGGDSDDRWEEGSAELPDDTKVFHAMARRVPGARQAGGQPERGSFAPPRRSMARPAGCALGGSRTAPGWCTC